MSARLLFCPWACDARNLSPRGAPRTTHNNPQPTHTTIISISITIEETDSGISCNIEGNPGTSDKKTTDREYAFGKAVSDLLSANAKMIARVSELETSANGFGKRIAALFKDAAREAYAVSEEEFNAMVKDSTDMNSLREKLEAHAKAKKPADKPAEEKPAEPCDLAGVEAAVKEEIPSPEA